jgi:hypothetical protein
MLSFATAQNIAKIKEFVSLIQDSTSTTRNFEKALKAAFSYHDIYMYFHIVFSQ